MALNPLSGRVNGRVDDVSVQGSGSESTIGNPLSGAGILIEAAPPHVSRYLRSQSQIHMNSHFLFYFFLIVFHSDIQMSSQ
jgi:hypothetical protein